MNITPLKHLIRAQNFTFVYRNYWQFKKCGRVLICIITTIQGASLISSAYEIDFQNKEQFKTDLLIFFCFTVFATVLLILPLYHSKRFQQLMQNINAFYNIFNDRIYSEQLIRKQKSLTKVVSLFCVCKLLLAVVCCVLDIIKNTDKSVSSRLKYDYNFSFTELRLTFEYFILDALCFVVSEQLNAIIRSIDNVLCLENNKQKRQDLRGFVRPPDHFIIQYKLWMTAYKNIRYSANICNTMFSFEMSVVLLLTASDCITFLYVIVTNITSGYPISILISNLSTILSLLIALCVISHAGQRVNNSSIKLRRKLCEYYIHSVTDEKKFKMMTNFLRCYYELNIDLMGVCHINMPLLSSCIAFIISNTIIALQFDNVL